jgi:competence protein ComEC
MNVRYAPRMLDLNGRITAVILIALVAACALCMHSAFSWRQRGLRVSFLDVGSGDAIFVEGPTGVRMLIDGGPDASILRSLGAELSPFDRTLDAVIETHPGTEAIGGLVDVFREYEVRSFFSPGTEESSAASDAVRDAIAQEGDIKTAALTRGDRLDLGDGAHIDVLYPDRDVSGVDGDTGSFMLRIVYGKTSFLVTGAAPSAVEEYVLRLDGDTLKSDVLLAGNRGKKTSTSADFLAAVMPEYVVISVDADNKFGYPDQEVLDRIAAEGPNVKRTSDGPVRFTSDGVAVTFIK